jgi:hypothetical protein
MRIATTDKEESLMNSMNYGPEELEIIAQIQSAGSIGGNRV